jgi:ketosteroid isomerase-like protein
MTTRRRAIATIAAILPVAGLLFLTPAAAPAQDVILSPVPKQPCCFTNFRFSGTCRVMPRQGQHCENVLAYLNNFNSAGEAYCSSTYIRGGWTSVDCGSGAPSGQVGFTDKGYIQSEEPAAIDSVSSPAEADLLRRKQPVSGAVDRQDLKVADASVIQVRLEQPLDGQLNAGQELSGTLESDLFGENGEILAPAGSAVSAKVGAEPGWDQPESAGLQLRLVGTTTSAADLFGTVDTGDQAEATEPPSVHLTGDLVELSQDSVLSFQLKEVSNQPDDMRVLTTATSVWMEAFNTKDPVTIAGLSSDNGALLPPNGEAVIGRDAIYSYWRNLLADSSTRVELVNVETVVEGDLGYKAGRFELLDGNNEVVDRGKYIQIWKRSPAGYWELHRDIWNSSMPTRTTSSTGS